MFNPNPRQLRLIKASLTHLIGNLTDETSYYVQISTLVSPEDQLEELRVILRDAIHELERLGEE
jgi:hypothetical protein